MKIKKSIIQLVFVFVLILILELFFFRNVLGNGRLFGDSGDGRLTMLLTEHWWRFFTGRENFADLLMFFPAKGTIGYSDMFLGFGVIHSILRLFRLDMYLAYKYTLIVLHVFGSVSFFWLLNKKLRVNLFWSFFALISFSYSTTFANLAFGHSQMSTINFLPLLSIFFVSILQKWNDRKLRNVNSALFIATYVLICYTGWYIAFFIALFSLILLITYICRLALEKVSVKKIVINIFSTFGFDLLFLAIFAILLLIPFAVIYLPVLRNSGGYKYTPVYIPEVIDIFNVSPQNWLFGKAVARMKLNGGEVQTGFSIIVIAVFLLTFLRKKRHYNIYAVCFVGSLFVAVFIGMAICVKLSSSGIAGWYFVYKFIPGGKSVRAVGRFLFFLSFPLALSIALCGNSITVDVRKSVQSVVVAMLLVLVFAFQIRRGGALAEWNREASINAIAAVPTPPADMESFYLIPDNSDKRGIPYKQLDAYELATWLEIPTLNGYSGTYPPGWDGIWDFNMITIKDWIFKNQLQYVYGYDAAAKKWVPYS